MRVQYVPPEHKKLDTIMILIVVLFLAWGTLVYTVLSQMWGVNIAQ